MKKKKLIDRPKSAPNAIKKFYDFLQGVSDPCLESQLSDLVNNIIFEYEQDIFDLKKEQDKELTTLENVKNKEIEELESEIDDLKHVIELTIQPQSVLDEFKDTIVKKLYKHLTIDQLSELEQQFNLTYA